MQHVQRGCRVQAGLRTPDHLAERKLEHGGAFSFYVVLQVQACAERGSMQTNETEETRRVTRGRTARHIRPQTHAHATLVSFEVYNLQ